MEHSRDEGQCGDRFAAEAEGEYLCAEDTVVHRVSHMLHDNILFIMRRHPPNIVTQPDLPVGCATRRERDGQTGEGRTRSFTPSLLTIYQCRSMMSVQDCTVVQSISWCLGTVLTAYSR